MPFTRRRGGSQMMMRVGLYATFINQLIEAGAIALWDAGAGVYSDAGITPVAADGAVQQWNDQSVGAYHVSQAGAATLRPTYRESVAALNNRPALEWDGGDNMTRAVAGGLLAAAGDDWCGVLVFATTSAELDYAYSEGNSGTATPSVRIGKNIGQGIGVHRPDATTPQVSAAGGTGANDGAVHIVGFRRLDNDSYSVMLDGTEVATATAAVPATTITHIGVGALYTAGGIANQWNGYLAHVSLYPTDVYAQVRPILDAWYRPA